jgi:SAM-dependent methyltransferase
MSFEVLAPHYTWLEAVLAGPRLQRCRTTWLDSLAGCERVLVAGIGHGHFLRTAAVRFPALRFTAIDASPGMLRHARQRAQRGGVDLRRIEFVEAALPAWRAPVGAYDAVVTNFFLDCFAPPELGKVVAQLAGATRGDARWLLADFRVPSRGWRRRRARLIHGLMYAFFRRVTAIKARRVTDPDPLLRANGFTLIGRKTSEWGLLHSDLWQRIGTAP